ncbi:MAG: enoyl-CoA hydratase/isomerase family protein [Actinomycetota bacterium]
MTDFQTIAYTVSDGVATIELARPEKRNAIDETMFRELGRAAEQAAEDPEVRVVLVKGQGPSFCAGIDLNFLAQLSGLVGASPRDFIELAQRPARLLHLMEKPTIAAVRGHALGAGFQLALACDLRIAAEDAQFAIWELRYGIIPDLGGNEPLASLVGIARAKEIVWTGRLVTADEADRIGLVNRVVPAEMLQKETEALVEELAAAPPIPLALTKAIYNRIDETPYEAVLEREAESQLKALASEDHKEAVAAFLEKRPPRYSGR